MKSYDIVEWGRPLQECIREIPVPRATEVLLSVSACGICHSDLHIRDGFLDLGEDRKVSFESLGLKLPFTLGHEIVGTVVAAGPEADVPLGAKRVVYPWIGCGECRLCRLGNELCCERNIALGTRRAGGFADYVLVPHSRYLLDYGTLDPLVAATCACSGLTAYSALKKLPPLGPEDTLLLLGAGGLGLAALSLAKAMTSARLVVADIDGAKLALASSMNSCEILDMRQPDAKDQLAAIAGEPVRAVIDFVGAPGTIDFAIKSAGKGATIVVVGLFGGALQLPTAMLPSRNLVLRGSYVGTLEEMRDLLALVQTTELLKVPLETLPMAQVNEALEILSAGKARGRFVGIN